MPTGARPGVPALPAADPEHGEIRWDRWERALLISHIDPSCVTCGNPGPLAVARGRTWYTPPPTMTRVQRSSRHNARPSRWVPVHHQPYWCYTHWALRCQQCDETTVWRMGDWEEIAYRPPRTERAAPAP